MSTDYPADIPERFAPLPDGVVENAIAAVWQALDLEKAVPRLCRYYKVEGDFAGATFVRTQPVDDDRFTAADLFSLTLLSVAAPSPGVARRILEVDPTAARLRELLNSEELDVGTDLSLAGAPTLSAMAELYDAVKQTLGSDPWVTASKLCARKRPALFPVRDKLVRGLLGLTRHGNYQIDWQVFRAIMQDDDIVRRLHEIRDEAVRDRGDEINVDPFPLRWLDVALWMHAKDGAERS